MAVGNFIAHAWEVLFLSDAWGSFLKIFGGDGRGRNRIFERKNFIFDIFSLFAPLFRGCMVVFH